MKTFNLEEWNGKRKVRTVVWNTSYQLCKGLKKREEDRREYGSYFIIRQV